MTTAAGGSVGLAFLLLAGLGAGWRYRAEPAVALTFGLGLLCAAVAWSGLCGLLTMPWLLTLATLAAVAGARVRPQPGAFYGGWVTDEIVGPYRGEAGTGE